MASVPRSSPSAGPFFVTVSGLKKSGKTTAAEALVAGLLARGFRTGAVKSIRHTPQPLDRPGTDTWRLAQAGAAFVVGQAPRETMYLERHNRPRRLRELSRLFPEGIQVVVSEGLEDPAVEPWHVVCLESPARLAETLSARRLDTRRIVALSGVFASRFGARGKPAEGTAGGSGDLPGPGGYPVYDPLDPAQREALIDRLLQRFGDPRPVDPPGGPLARDPGWRPAGGG